MFSIPSPISFQSIFLYILLGVLIWYYSSFDLKDRRGKKPTGFFNYLSQKAFKWPGFKVSFWISIVTHACQDADMTSWEESSGKAKGCIELMLGTSDAVTQTTVSKIEAAEPTS